MEGEATLERYRAVALPNTSWGSTRRGKHVRTPENMGLGGKRGSGAYQPASAHPPNVSSHESHPAVPVPAPAPSNPSQHQVRWWRVPTWAERRSGGKPPRDPRTDGKNQMDWKSMEERYRAVALMNTDPRAWYVQQEYGARFKRMYREMRRHDLQQMLMGDCWIACIAPSSGTDRIEFDLDASSPDDLSGRDARYWKVREVIGLQHEPLVYVTPSGYGLRVVYRIPSTKLDTLVSGVGRGDIADLLRDAGLTVRQGVVEIFPQKKVANRLPLGSSMPILEPHSLRPLPCAGLAGDAGDQLVAGLEHLEAWHAAPCATLVEEICSRAAKLTRRKAPESPASTSGVGFDPRRLGYRVSSETHLLLNLGLQESGTRYDAEWRVGLALSANPEVYAQYGLGMRRPSDEQVARAIAGWLAERNNGCSAEWSEALRRGAPDEAVQHFVGRYLTRGPDGSHMIDRLRRALEKANVGARGREIGADERRQAMEIAEKWFEGAQRYRFEVWMCAFFRARRSIVRYHASLGEGLSLENHPGGGRSVVVEIAASWMEGWPNGEGGGKNGQPARYRQYRDVLTAEGLLIPETLYSHPSQRYPGAKDLPGVATGYRTPYPAEGGKSVGIPWPLVEAACVAPAFGEKPVNPDEAFHILHLAALAESGLDLGRRYGRRTAERVKDIAEKLRCVLNGDAARPSEDVPAETQRATAA